MENGFIPLNEKQEGTVSEGLNSVETNILTNTRNYPDWVSEELNSVETLKSNLSN